MSDPVPAQFWERAYAADVASFAFSGLVLASRSPQRKTLLEQLRIPFRIVVSDHEEGGLDGDPAHTVQQNARGKAEEVLAREELRPGELVLGVDTVVVSDGEILGKARDAAEASSFVRRLAARRHEVYSGLYLTTRKLALATHAVTGVTFRSLTDAELEAYISSGEWRDRAGAYAIQGIGSALVAAVDGDYFNVVGLPVAELQRLLAGFGVTPFSWLPGGAPAA
ncbi:MAG TPA: Maf family protein [Thermoleophilia bacterium]|nr:Maf family protein [Thermoleophilia bacterium]